MYAVIQYVCRENGERRIISADMYDCRDEAEDAMRADAERFRDAIRDKYVLHDDEFDDQCRIDIRGGYNEFYTWEIVEVTSEEQDVENVEADRMLEQQELEDFEQADEYFGYASDVFGAEM